MRNLSTKEKWLGLIGKILLISLIILLSAGRSYPQAAKTDPYAPAPKTIEGWVEFDPPIPPVKERDPKYPWLPKGPFPYKASWPKQGVPYTGEELAYFQDMLLWSGKYQNATSYYTQRNKRGLIINKNILILRQQEWDTYQDVLDYDEGAVKLHTPKQKVLTLIDSPPEVRGMGLLTVQFLNAPGKWKDPDRYTYIPALRRTRRSAGGDRQDDVLGTMVSNDDFGERQPWEEEHFIVAQDVICENNQQRNIIGPVKELVEHPMNASPGVWGEGDNPYREDGCVECWVVMSKHRDPKYYLGYRLTWQEKRTKVEVRQEQYDREGNLWKISARTWYYVPGGHLKGGVAKSNVYWWDLKRDFSSYQWFGDWIFGEPIDEGFFTVPQLTKEYFWRTPPKYRQVTNVSQFPPYIEFYPEKKSRWRKGVETISPELLAKVKAQDELWRKRGGFDAWGWAKGTKYKDLE